MHLPLDLTAERLGSVPPGLNSDDYFTITVEAPKSKGKFCKKEKGLPRTNAGSFQPDKT
jgi:hypothetical protein